MAIEEITRRHTFAEVAVALRRAAVPHSPITPIEEVMDLPFVKGAALRTVAPDGSIVRLPPPAVGTPHLDQVGGQLPFAPGYGEQTDSVLAESGLAASEIAALRSRGIVA